MKKTFNEFMNEQRLISRWTILRVGILGMLAGSVLTVIYMLGIYIL